MQHRSSTPGFRANEDRIMWRRPFDDQARIRDIRRDAELVDDVSGEPRPPLPSPALPDYTRIARQSSL